MGNSYIIQRSYQCARQGLDTVSMNDNQVRWILLNIVGESLDGLCQGLVHIEGMTMVDETVDVLEAALLYFVDGSAVGRIEVHAGDEDTKVKWGDCLA